MPECINELAAADCDDDDAFAFDRFDTLSLWSAGDVEKLQSWMGFLKSAVTDHGLSIKWNTFPTTRMDPSCFMSLVKAVYPRLTRMSFEATDQRIDWASSFTRLERLRLYIPPTDIDGIVRLDLTPLRALRTLSFGTNDDSDSDDDDDASSVLIDGPSFGLPPSLELLSLRSCEIQNASGFLARLPALRALYAQGATLFLDQNGDGLCHDVGVPASLRELSVNRATFSQHLLESLVGDGGLPNLEILDVMLAGDVPFACADKLPAVREMFVRVDDHATPFQQGMLDPLMRLTALRELTYETKAWVDATTLPYLPGITRLEITGNHSIVDVAYSLPDLKHLRVSFPADATSLEPLSRLTALTSLVLDGEMDHDPANLPHNLHMVSSLRHLCMHAHVKGGITTRRALGACSIQTVCTRMHFEPDVPRPTFSVIECPVPTTRFHVEY